MPPTLEFELWTDIQDIIGPARCWPQRIRTLFWTKNLNHYQRIDICRFVFVNGLNPVVLLEWCDLKGLARDYWSRNEIRTLMASFELDPGRYNWYSWNVMQNRYEKLDGTVVRY